MRKEAARGPKDRREDAGGAFVLRATAAARVIAACSFEVQHLLHHCREIDRSFSTPFQHSGLLSRDGARSLPARAYAGRSIKTNPHVLETMFDGPHLGFRGGVWDG